MFSRDPLLLDGGLATELEARGHDVSGTLWSAELLQSAPEAIERLHYDYFVAGARCAITASYQASYQGFARLGIGADETTRLLRLSVQLACSARDRYRRDRAEDRDPLYVAASVGPYGAISHDGAEYRGDYGLTVAELVEFHARRFDVLATSESDLLACETLPLLDEARALATLLARYPAARAWFSFTSPDGIRTAHGEALADCARLLDGIDAVVAVGVNCVRPEMVAASIASLRSATRKPIVVYPNSGERWDGGTHDWQGHASEASLAALAPAWVRAGASLVGGCCRVGPDQISALRESLAPCDRLAGPVKAPR